MSSKLSVSFIIHNDFSHIRPALRSLYATVERQMDVYVVLNLPNEVELSSLRKEYPEITFLTNDTPRGFAANHNKIMKLVETEFVVLLNDDIVLYPHALDILLEYLEHHPQVGVVGPQLLNLDGSLQVSAYSDPNLLRMLYKISGLARLTHQRSRARTWLQKLGIFRLFKVESLDTRSVTRAVPVIKGAVMVVRRAAYQQVGLMHEATLAYGEETDWHFRMRQHGWQIVLVPEARVTHYGSGQAELKLHGQLLIEDRKAILYYWIKHRPRWQTILLRGAVMSTHGLWGLLWLPLSPARAKIHFRTALIGITWTP